MMTKEKLAEICFHCGVGSPEDLDMTQGEWKEFSYNLEDLKDQKYVIIAPINSSKVGYEIKGENNLKIVEDLVKAFETYKDDDEEEGIEVFDVTENKFLNYDIKLEKSVGVKWNGFV